MTRLKLCRESGCQARFCGAAVTYPRSPWYGLEWWIPDLLTTKLHLLGLAMHEVLLVFDGVLPERGSLGDQISLNFKLTHYRKSSVANPAVVLSWTGKSPD
jgi:hypothetical protein